MGKGVTLPGMPNTPTATLANQIRGPCLSVVCCREITSKDTRASSGPPRRMEGTPSSTTAVWMTSATPPSLWCLRSTRCTQSISSIMVMTTHGRKTTSNTTVQLLYLLQHLDQHQNTDQHQPLHLNLTTHVSLVEADCEV